MSKYVFGISITAVARDRSELFEALAFLAREELFRGDQVRDVQPGRRALGQRDRASLDPLAILQAVEPALRDRVDTIVSAGHRPENRAGCIRIASQVHDIG